MIIVLHGDCAEKLPELTAGSVDAVVTDSPYALSFMGKDWDSFGDGIGYQAWCETWAAECLRVLKPGGHLVAFGGTRTYHRLACAIEDAGFEIRDSLHWLYGSGFPKSLDVSKAIDKAAGRIGHSMGELKERLREAFDHSGKTRSAVDTECGFRAANYLTIPGDGKRPDPWVEVLPSPEKWQVMKAVLGYGDDLDGLFAAAQREVVGTRKAAPGVAFTSKGPTEIDVTAPATEDAARWSGFGTALKPAHEPIVLARKPLSGTVASNVLAHGTGALNVDGCRVEASGRPSRTAVFNGYEGDTYGTGRNTGLATGTTDTGRWPPNILLTHSAECNGTCATGCPVAALDAQSGRLTSGNVSPEGFQGEYRAEVYGRYARNEIRPETVYADSGGASRFFPQLAWSPDYDAPFMYQAKAGRKERPRIDGMAAHPTVKPLALMRWLVRLVTPPGGTVLDPFAGTGTTGEACHLEGFDCVLVERDADYIKLIEARMSKYAQEAA